MRWEVGKEVDGAVHYDEGVANHIGLKPCVFVRKDECEASAEVRIGQPLSRERISLWVADVLRSMEGNSDRCVTASV
ncbi:MAG: hypothetical protein FWG81_09920 [Betaproteobacteria bacterium]|nr:hypothetical protein [Betaproteobacteria bacterium]